MSISDCLGMWLHNAVIWAPGWTNGLVTCYMSCPGDWYVFNYLLLSGSERSGLIAIVFSSSLFILSRFMLFKLSHRPICKRLIVVLMMEAMLSLTVYVCFCLVIACLGVVTFVFAFFLVFV